MSKSTILATKLFWYYYRQTLLALILIFSGDMASLIDYFSFTIWIFYVMAMVVLLLLRKTQPDAYRPYKVSLIIPVLVIIIGSYLVVAPLVTDPAIEYAYIGGVVLLGFFVYIPFVYKKWSMQCLGKPLPRQKKASFSVYYRVSRDFYFDRYKSSTLSKKSPLSVSTILNLLFIDKNWLRSKFLLSFFFLSSLNEFSSSRLQVIFSINSI